MANWQSSTTTPRNPPPQLNCPPWQLMVTYASLHNLPSTNRSVFNPLGRRSIQQRQESPIWKCTLAGYYTYYLIFLASITCAGNASLQDNATTWGELKPLWRVRGHGRGGNKNSRQETRQVGFLETCIVHIPSSPVGWSRALSWAATRRGRKQSHLHQKRRRQGWTQSLAPCWAMMGRRLPSQWSRWSRNSRRVAR